MRPTLGRMLLVVLLAAGLLVVAPGSAAADGGHKAQTQSASDATVDEDLRERADGGIIDVVVRMSAGQSTRAHSSEASTQRSMQQDADDTQVAIESFAEDKDGVEHKRGLWLTNAVLLTVNTSEVDLKEIARVDGVTMLEPNYQVTITAQSTEATARSEDASSDVVTSTYGVDQINATEFWDAYDTRGEGVNIAVLDSGVDPDHPDIELQSDGPAWAEFDSGRENTDPFDSADDTSHGTHVSGIATGGNASGTQIGVAPAADLMVAKVLEGRTGSLIDVIDGFQWAVDNDADIVSMSLGANRTSDFFIDAIRNARSTGTVVVASTGNSGDGTTSYPGFEYDTVGTGAVGPNRTVPDFSSGRDIDPSAAASDDNWDDSPPSDWPDTYTTPMVVSAGNNVYSAQQNNTYGTLTGTSMATPHVAGAIALLMSAAGETLTPDEIDNALRNSSWKPDGEATTPDTRYGHGIVDATALAEEYNGSLNGTVTITGENDFHAVSAGDPIEDAEVALHEGKEISGSPTAVEITNSDGEYDFGALVAGKYTLVLTADKFKNKTVTVVVGPKENQMNTVGLHYKQAKIAGDVGFTVPTENESVNVTVTATDGESTFDTTVTMPMGETTTSYVITVVPDLNSSYEVTTTAAGYNTNTTTGLDVALNETISFDPTLTAENASLFGTVTRSGLTKGVNTGGETAGQGQPIAEANVTLHEGQTTDTAIVETAETNLGGKWSFEALSPDKRYTVRINHPNYTAVERAVTAGPAETVSMNTSLKYAAPGAIAGIVSLDLVDPEENVTVKITAEGISTNTTVVKLADDENRNTYKIEELAVDPTDGYEIVATTESAYTNTSVTSVSTSIDATTTSVDVPLERDIASSNSTYHVDINATNEPVRSNEPLQIDAIFSNGGERSPHPVSITIETESGETIFTQTRTLALGAGESVERSFEWLPSPSERGEYNVTVTTLDDADSRLVTIPAPDSRAPPAGSISGGSGGGGGGGSGDQDEQSSVKSSTNSEVNEINRSETTVPETPADVTVLEEWTGAFDNDGKLEFATGAPVESIRFQNTTTDEVIVRQLSDVPNVTGNLPGSPLVVSELFVPDSIRDQPATLRKSIDMNTQDVNEGASVSLFRYNPETETWQSIETEANRGPGSQVILETEVSGSSYFAVTTLSAPEAIINAPSQVNVGESTAFDGSDSSGKILNYTWSISGYVYHSDNVTVDFEQAGVYTVSLTVTDVVGETSTVSQTIEVTQSTPSSMEDTTGNGMGFGAVIALLVLLASRTYLQLFS